ncbi:unnamed protein product [Calypogeia fissa]
MANPNNQYQQPPPYPYQQPLQGEQHSGDYAPYPQVNNNDQQADQKWGTPVMGAPANPSAHPDNQQAATGSIGGSDRHGSGSLHDQVKASQSQPSPSVSNRAPGQDPYVQSSPTATSGGAPGNKEGGSMDKIKAQVAEYSKQAEEVMNRVWGHLSTGPSMKDTAWGRVTAGTQFLTKGGFEGVFKSTFPADADEKLQKTYACFLSTSTGPVGGTLYISNKKIAFCSDRPLSYTPEGGQQSFSYYKVIVPVDKVAAVNPSTNKDKPAEKYIQVVTKDNFEFWFMGFVNYDKGVKNLQAVLTPENQQGGQQGGQAGGPAGGQPNQQAYPPNQQAYPPNQQAYPPNQQQNYVPPNQYGTPSR